MKQDSSIRVRFAPSPTGTLHVGGARTALFNWLFAKSQKGKFILRIEDTDQSRYDAESEQLLIQDIQWLGLEWDEGPDKQGEYGPYRQSKRLDIYQEHVTKLLDQGSAYRCFCSIERLAALKEEQRITKQRSGYDRHCRNLTKEQIDKNLSDGLNSVIRLKVPEQGATSFKDFLRGDIEYQNGELDDLVLLKSDGFPSYHLANVVDDHLMAISHVLRGDEWIPSTPKHIILYQSFGWDPPQFVHLPVILAEGGGKLSKRKGAASVTDYKNLGFLPHTLINFLSLLGWSPGNDVEIMTLEELCHQFSLERINPKSCAFDGKKLEWMNGQYINHGKAEDLIPEIRNLYMAAGIDIESKTGEYLLKVISALQPRVKLLPEFVEAGRYFFQDPEEYEAKAEKKHFKEGVDNLIQSLINKLNGLESFAQTELENAYGELVQELELPGLGKLVHPTRLSVSGISFGPGLFEMLEILGKDTVLRRMEKALEYLRNKN